MDPLAIRVALGGVPTASATPAMVIEPSGRSDEPGRRVIVDGAPLRLRLDRSDAFHAILVDADESMETRTRALLLPVERLPGRSAGVVRREVVVDGWRVEVDIEPERRASLREWAQRGREATAHADQTQVRAIIPGRIVSVSIVPGDPVVAGQQLLVIEAMKMENELRAPRDGIVSSVAVGVGATIEVGDLMLVIE